MKIAIFGAGAIGSYLGVRLHQSGAEVSMIARGAHLAAIRANGLTLLSEGKSVTVHPFATSQASEGGVQDYVFVTLKAHTLPAAAPEIAKLLGSETALITAMNGRAWCESTPGNGATFIIVLPTAALRPRTDVPRDVSVEDAGAAV